MKIEEIIEYTDARLSSAERKTPAADFAKAIVTNLTRMLNLSGHFARIEVIKDETTGSSKSDSYYYEAEIIVHSARINIRGTSRSGAYTPTSREYVVLTLKNYDGTLTSELMYRGKVNFMTDYITSAPMKSKIILLYNKDSFFVAITNSYDTESNLTGGSCFVISEAKDLFSLENRTFGLFATFLNSKVSDLDESHAMFIDLCSSGSLKYKRYYSNSFLSGRSDDKMSFFDLYADNGRIKLNGLKEITPTSSSFIRDSEGKDYFCFGNIAIEF